ncbi:MAG TPA: DUF2163 domain-containing protein [Sphingopyxis sp.]|nr:DUF2163 domain-containing protein [Sphingopyxis sp.]
MGMTAAPPWLREEVVTMAWCWRLSRRDGIVIGLTSHDRDLLWGGIVYRAAPGMRPSALEHHDHLDAATMDLEGAVTSDAIMERDLDVGRWDGARMALYITDWTEPDTAPLLMAEGVLGTIERRGASFVAELQGVTRALDAPVCPATSPSCRAALGDRSCRINLAPLTHMRQVIGVDGATVTLNSSVAAGRLIYGHLLWVEGPNCGTESPIISQNGSVLQLAQAPALPAQGALRVRLVEGCDKQLVTCRTRFANAANFRGEAHLPGNDLLTRYPGG